MSGKLMIHISAKEKLPTVRAHDSALCGAHQRAADGIVNAIGPEGMHVVTCRACRRAAAANLLAAAPDLQRAVRALLAVAEGRALSADETKDVERARLALADSEGML